MVDFHTHILPGVDDGTNSIDEALAAAENATKQGIKKIVATPHYLEDKFHLTPAETRGKVAELQENIDKQELDVEILPGAEIYITPDMATKVSEKKVITINDSRYVLLELPPGRIPHYTNSVLYNLKAMGYIPVIAHPERYQAIIENPNQLYYWVKNKIYSQLNAGSLMGFYGSTVRKTAEILVKHKLVHFLGSDLHSAGKRSKYFEKAVDRTRKISGVFADKMIKNAELAVKDKKINVVRPQYYENDNMVNKLKKFMGFEKRSH